MQTQHTSRQTHLVDPDTGCWVWQGWLRGGYARATRNGRLVTVHRWNWEQAHGPVPEGLHLDHLCRNRACVNPDHLEAVTHTINIRRGANTKLTEELVAEIKSQHRESPYALAERYGVSVPTIGKIRSGQHWADVGERHQKHEALGEPTRLRTVPDLTEAEVLDIRNAPRHYGSGRALAHKYGVSDGAISDIRLGKSRRG